MPDIDELKGLAEKLCSLQSIARFDAGDEREGWRIAIGLDDIKVSADRIFIELLPALRGEVDEGKINDILTDIGEELRHIIYHVRDMKYFGYVE
jgi:hypothetical protein